MTRTWKGMILATLIGLMIQEAVRAETRSMRAGEATARAMVRREVPETYRVGRAVNREPLPASLASAQSTLVVLPVFPITAAPNQPEIQPNDTRGIINALCDVQLYIVGCSFRPNAATLSCDSNGDGVDDMLIPLRDVRIINGNLVRVTIPALSPQLPGTAFPLTCCGGHATLTLSQKIGDGDDNIFGEYTVKSSAEIDLGMRAPVVISASPSGFDCSILQNLQIPGACFVFPDGTTNVTSVFAVEVGNPANVVQAKHFVVFNSHLIDALFDFGTANAGKTFLIFVSGPNGTSRNMTVLPSGAPAGCPTGNEQGVKITVTCERPPAPGGAPSPPPLTAVVSECRLERTDAGGFLLTVTGQRFKRGAFVTIGGAAPKKVKMKAPELEDGENFRRLILKGNFCNNLPGTIVVTNPNEPPSQPFQCTQTCVN